MTDISASPTAALMRPVKLTLQAEGLIIGAAATLIFARLDGSWLLFAALLLAPDIAMLGYLKGNRLGALAYNLGHSYVLPALLSVAGYGLQNDLMMHMALIWTAHVGFDRAIGYGLKYQSGFKDTHLGRV